MEVIYIDLLRNRWSKDDLYLMFLRRVVVLSMWFWYTSQSSSVQDSIRVPFAEIGDKTIWDWHDCSRLSLAIMLFDIVDYNFLLLFVIESVSLRA